MSFCVKHHEDVNKCWNEFESSFSGTVFDHAQIKILSKKDQKLKAKLWITRGIIVSINLNLMFKFSTK